MPHLPWLILSNGDGNDNLASKTPEHPFNVDWNLVLFSLSNLPTKFIEFAFYFSGDVVNVKVSQ